MAQRAQLVAGWVAAGPDSECCVQVHGYSALGAPFAALQHQHGSATVFIAHTLVQSSIAADNGAHGTSPAVALPFVADANILYHIHVLFSCVPA